MAYDIYILEESNLKISGGRGLDGAGRGNGADLVGQTIVLSAPAWIPLRLEDWDEDFTDGDGSQKLVGSQVIDGVKYAEGTVVEPEYEITLTDGVNSWIAVAFNVNNSDPAGATSEGLAFIGGPGGFPPTGVELKIVRATDRPSFAKKEFATPICFASGTLIETPDGPRRVDDIAVGDLVLTRDRGPRPVLWRASRAVPAIGALAPILFRPGAVGNARPLRLSPQHRLRVAGWRAELFAGVDAALVAARHFVDGRSVVVESGGLVTYHHIMFDRHEIVVSEGVETESFCPGDVGLRGLDGAARHELFRLFPELGVGRRAAWLPVHPTPASPVARLLARAA